MSWMKTYPKVASKNELRGKKLRVFADKPPEDSNIKGMKNLIVFDADNSTSYQILVTNKDIMKILDLEGRFTFDQSQPWAEVIAE